MSQPLATLKKTFRESLDKFVDSCIPLQMKENCLYFLSDSSQLYGFDIAKNLLFEPSSVNKFNLINGSLETYFTDEVKRTLEEKAKLKFEDLVELIVKMNYREKHIGRKFYFQRSEKRIYVWSMVSTKWEKLDDVDSLRHIFSNNDILTDQNNVRKSTKAKSLDDLGIDYNDLEEISLRFKDASIHYYHRKSNRIYSLNIASNLWYVPVDSVQRQLLAHVKKRDSEGDGTGKDAGKDVDKGVDKGADNADKGADKGADVVEDSSLNSLGIYMEDLEEIGQRFRDASIHYYHRKLNRVYSRSIRGNKWSIPDENAQKQLLAYVKKPETNPTQSEETA